MEVNHTNKKLILAIVLIVIVAAVSIAATQFEWHSPGLVGAATSNVRTITVATMNSTDASLLVAEATGEGRSAIILQNNSTVVVYIGNSDVTNTTGYALQPRGTYGSILILTKVEGFDVESAIYGCTVSEDEAIVFVLEEYVP